jgi:uncharacterized protein (TIGR00369 family)
MTSNRHYHALKAIYFSAPMTKLFPPEIHIEHGKASISLVVKEDYFHIAKGLHGSVYFKLLDDASAFAAYSVIEDCFAYTANFNINFTGPVNHGKITAVGTFVRLEGRKLYTTSQLFNEYGIEIANAEGLFVKSAQRFMDLTAYKNAFDSIG